jgi:D-glycero-D-manno-heptose 1,7-bisphosphate phosphatase
MKLVLADRDGVINEEIPGYVTSPRELILLPQALKAFALFRQEGFTAVVITNQSVVGRGIISLDTLHSIHEFMQAGIEAHGGKIDEVFICTDLPDAASRRRKPEPGMLLEALEKYGADAQETCFIGDALTDMQAAHAAGCRRYLVMTGKGRSVTVPDDLQPVTFCADILDAARKIVSMPR